MEGATGFKKYLTKKNIFLAVCAVFVIALIVVAIIILSKGAASPQKAAEKYVEAVFEEDAKKVIKVLSPFAKNKLLEYDASKEATDGEVETALEQKLFSSLPNGIKINYAKATASEVFDDEYTIGIIKAAYSQYADAKITKYAKVTVKFEAEYEGKTETEEIAIDCVKIGLRWFVLDATT